MNSLITTIPHFTEGMVKSIPIFPREDTPLSMHIVEILQQLYNTNNDEIVSDDEDEDKIVGDDEDDYEDYDESEKYADF